MPWPPFLPTIIPIRNLKKFVVKEALENVLGQDSMSEKWQLKTVSWNITLPIPGPSESRH